MGRSGLVEHPGPPDPRAERGDEGEKNEPAEGGEVVEALDRGEGEAGVVEDEPLPQGLPALLGDGEGVQVDGPDEDDHHQGRDVAEELDVGGGELLEDPVAGEPGDADQRSEDQRDRDADDDDAHGVPQAGNDRLLDGVGRGEGIVGDRYPRRLIEEVEAEIEPEVVGPVPEVRPQVAEDGVEDTHRENLGAE